MDDGTALGTNQVTHHDNITMTCSFQNTICANGSPNECQFGFFNMFMYDFDIPESQLDSPGKSCTAQVLNLTQHIEDGFETGKITCIVLVDLSAAYDTVNHRRLREKVYNMTRDYRLMCMIRTLLENRRFFVELAGKRSGWRSQRNGLPQGSVLAPLLFNVYTNDQSIHPGTRSFVYADDVAVTTQSTELHRSRKHGPQL